MIMYEINRDLEIPRKAQNQGQSQIQIQNSGVPASPNSEYSLSSIVSPTPLSSSPVSEEATPVSVSFEGKPPQTIQLTKRDTGRDLIIRTLKEYKVVAMWQQFTVSMISKGKLIKLQL